MNNDQSQTINQPPMLNRSYGGWPQVPLPPPPEDPMKFQNPPRPGFPVMKRSNWKGKKNMDKRRKEMAVIGSGSNTGGGGGAGGGGGNVGGGYQPPTLHELQFQNRLKARRFYPKKKYNRFAPFAPRNTTSFIIRAKKSGGIASLVSPCPVTPAILPTPIFSPSREVLVDMAKEEWGVDGYGSMKGLIRLRSPGHEVRDDEEEDEGGSSESDVEEHVEVERRLDHDLSRFEMIYPNCNEQHSNMLENRVDDQDAHIAQLEEENLTLKERLFLMERELADLRMRLQFLEAGGNRGGGGQDENNDEASDNEGIGDVCSEKSVGDGD
ncbi:hypothetical protein BVC80_4067g1 [Macleaya cordata]|uniref:PRLI-interacting factor A n=1 Tax=Macleaya cordata TaxID=56857 RepID=A0A200PMY0_MACCD|nr:hypothetical protein BVC80_4067g1 [Macleaya cordata]